MLDVEHDVVSAGGRVAAMGAKVEESEEGSSQARHRGRVSSTLAQQHGNGMVDVRSRNGESSKGFEKSADHDSCIILP